MGLGDNMFQEIDIVKMNGDINSALKVNTRIHVSGRTLTIVLQFVKGSHTSHTIIIDIETIEIFEIVRELRPILQLMKVLLKHFLEFEALKMILMNKNFAEIEEFVSVEMVIHVFHSSIHGVELGDE
uniref:Uncharacterized protein n=1 Tax=Lactuca sativa TaxID=4236 RepID=A0A9R1WU54_LACSA|nr:hypothetical protein LSAT_V11C900469920 [Lactuca sativa]